MKYNININQKGLEFDKNISMVDASVIDWIHTFCGTNNRKINSQKVDGFTWVNLTHLMTDMPLLRITSRGGASKLLTRLADLGYIDKKTEKRKTYVRPTEKIDILYFDKVVSLKKDVVSKSEQSCELGENYHNTNNTNIILDTPKSVPQVEKVVIPFSLKEELTKLIESHWKPHKIMYVYFRRKDFKFENKKQFDIEVKRNLKPAKSLEGYNSKQIEETIEYCIEQWGEMWTLETVGKWINKVISDK